ncbi:tyrosine-type recombinase/integrase [Opitutus terrae]|uniref:Integrase family protein n=1 Tax=Opitutus terrae (strain DSM 11246 / JCM 15787 / PB90-1) TaxID=452637 RepID=B1ZPW5_OPITP|nr:site-specific integrase [Opitutus terrae]ACB75571.1 integrase family protein [Opitutus terrae PB90-1]
MPPLAYRVHKAVFSTGERFPILLTREGLPVSLPTRYVIDEHRERSQTNTIGPIIRAISYFYEWCATLAEPFDPEVRLRDGPLLDRSELIGLQRYLRAGRRHNVIVFPKRTQAFSRASAVMKNGSLNTQLDRIRDFLVWAADFAMQPRAPTQEIDRLKRAMDALHLTRTRSKDKLGLTLTQQGELLRIVDSGSENLDNPFSRQVRARNQTIVRLLLETGIRRGELCKLRVEDVNLRDVMSASIAIVRNPDDPFDPRRDEPQVKTLNRRIPLRGATKDLMFEYLLKHRGLCRHPYFFTSSRGAVPLDVTAVNRIFTRIREASNAFAGVELTPHIMRHTFEENLARQVEALGWPEKKVNDVTNYLSGWVDQSKQAVVYLRRANEEFAMVAMSKLHALNDKIGEMAIRRASDGIPL